MYDHITTLIFDVDGTLTHDGQVAPALLPRLQALRERGLRLALCTARSLAEGVDFVTRELGATVAPDGLFNGGLVLEDGHVWLPPGAASVDEVAVVTRAEAHAEMEAFRAAFRAAWRPSDDPAFATRGWGTVAGVDEPLVQEIPAEWATLGSVSIWKESRAAGWPHYRGEHDAFTDWALAAAERLELRHTLLAETGAATLRVLERGLNKGTALERLGFDLGRALFIGDGLNDIPVIEVMRARGGTVMAVANAVEPIRAAAAAAVSARPASEGVVELLALLERAQA